MIDLVPYWHPPAYASAIVIADALVWEGAPTTLVDAWSALEHWDQYLARALIARIVTDAILSGGTTGVAHLDVTYAAAVEAVLSAGR